MNILITGSPGVGKTTLIRRVLEEMSGEVGGFYTEEIREKGIRKGFKVTNFDGQEGVLAHVDIESPFRVGKYGVDIEVFEWLGVSAVERAVREEKTVVIDEIGKMELHSARFRSAVLSALDGGSLVLATIGRISDPFVEEIKRRKDVHLLVVTPGNRDALVSEVAKLVKDSRGGEDENLL